MNSDIVRFAFIEIRKQANQITWLILYHKIKINTIGVVTNY